MNIQKLSIFIFMMLKLNFTIATLDIIVLKLEDLLVQIL